MLAVLAVLPSGTVTEVHYSMDSTEGIILGETFAARLLHQVTRPVGHRLVDS